jgi:hypothetical protein
MQVSVLTLTNYTRVKELELLLLNIIEQSVKIDELFILETDYIPENIKKSKENIERLYSVYEKQINFKMVYYIHDYDHNIEYVKSLSDAELIKIGNERTNGNIIFRMFDDTYYFPNYIEENIKILNNSDKQLNYCSNPCLYDSLINRYIKTDISKINKMYSSTLVYKKEFINNNDEIRINDINNFNNIDSLFIKIINENNYEYYRNDYFEKLLSNEDINIKLPNRYNTINKVLNNDNVSHDNVNVSHDNEYVSYDNVNVSHDNVNVSYDNEYVSHDIVYLNGYHTIVWNPEDKSLGGSEQAIVNLVTNWAKLGKKVIVYGEVEEMVHNGVEYVSWKKFPFEHKHKLLILWRLYGLWCTAPFPLKADKIWLDCHDNFGGLFPETWKKYGHVVQKVLFKSTYHKEEFEKANNEKLGNNRFAIIPNGIRVEEFLKNFKLININIIM